MTARAHTCRLDVIKGSFHQINYGTGSGVSDESIEEAGGPLEVRWHPGSVMELHLWRVGRATVEAKARR